MKKILIVVGTRPNFVKITQFKRIIAEKYKNELEAVILHTGQHYDNNMSDVFFQQFGLVPDYFLGIPQVSANTQMAEIMIRLEKILIEYKPDLVIVPGDVNSTLAASVTANKMNIKLAHLESGLRSCDRAMPEEHNRIVADHLADLLLVTEDSGLENLAKENIPTERILFVGNTMIDTMVYFEPQIQQTDIMNKLAVKKNEFVLMTMHRPATVDFKEGLSKLLELITHLSEKYKIIFPVHPRTVKMMQQHGLYNDYIANKRIILTDPMDYFAFHNLIANAKLIITDSGGIQEESTFRRIPCITLRNNTERPSTITIGTNTLLPFDLDLILKTIGEIESGTYKKGDIPPMWDGKSTERILEHLYKIL